MSSQALIDEFFAEFRRSGSAIEFTRYALQQLSGLIPRTDNPENPDPLISIGRGHPSEPGNRADGTWKRSELDSAGEDGGWLHRHLTHSWIALIFARWEHHYRPQIAAAHGVTTESVTCPVMGDFRRLRNDILHNGGVASADHTGKCTVITRFAVGDEIALSPADIQGLLEGLTVEIRSPGAGG